MTQPLSYETPVGTSTRAASRFVRVVPLAFITYSLAFLDRNNFGYATSGGMSATLKLTPGKESFLGAIFFIGYFLFQIPGAHYASQHSVRRIVFWALIFWGLFSSLTGVVTYLPALYVVRFMLGAVEGVVLPAMLVYLTRWFTRPERSRANSLLMLANPLTMMYASAMSGYIIVFFDKWHVLGFKGWQMMFIVEGIPSIVWAFIWLFMSRERPADVTWLDAEEATQVQRALDHEQAGIDQVKHYLDAFADARVVMLSVMFVFFSAASYAFMFWMPRIVKTATSQNIGVAGLLVAIPYFVACFSIVGVSWMSDKTLQRKPFVWGSNLLGATAYVVAALVVKDHFLLAFFALIVVGSCTYTPTSPQWAWMAEMLPRNVIGESMALVNSAGALGGFAGVYIGGYLNGHFNRPEPTFLFCAGCLLIATTIGLCIRSLKRPIAMFG